MCIRDKLKLFQQCYEEVIAKRNLFGFSFLYFKAMHKIKQSTYLEDKVVAEVLGKKDKKKET